MEPELSTTVAGSPHGGLPVRVRGAPVESARLAVVLLHGRGGTAAGIQALADQLGTTDVAYLAPEAAGSSWYPASFLAPTAQNQPGIDSAHRVIEALIGFVADRAPPSTPVALLGFSQGACLAADHGFRFPRRYAFVAALTGGLIGPAESVFEPSGSLRGTPVYLGASHPDLHVPWSRVEQTAHVLDEMGADVDLVKYQNAPHSVLPEQLQRVRELVAKSMHGSEA